LVSSATATVLNAGFALAPTAETAPIAAMPMKPSRRPYSTIVAPSSHLTNLWTKALSFDIEKLASGTRTLPN
jgi:hypothetical protein